jgi:hypothetical protein
MLATDRSLAVKSGASGDVTSRRRWPFARWLPSERSQRAWLLASLALWGVWTTELFLVQQKTLTFAQLTGERFAFWAP